MSAPTRVREHHWRQCYPAVVALPLPGVAPDEKDFSQAQLRAQQASDAIAAAWGRSSDEDRQGFHEFACRNSRAPEHVVALNRVLTWVRVYSAGI